MKIKVSYFLLFALLVSCNDGLYEEQEKESLHKISKTSLKAENHLIPVLETLGFSVTGKGRARINSSGFEIVTDSILKALQHDSLNYAYTFKIGTNNSEPVFENLILKSVTGGYIGFILRYESANGLTDLSKFTGKIKRFDLEENLLTERNFENGVLMPQQSSNARVGSGPSMLCLADVTLSLECADSPGPSETTGLPRDYMCQEWVWVVEYTYEPCPAGSTGGGGDDGGTFIPNPDPGNPGGGGNPTNDDGDEEIGVLPPDVLEQRKEEIKELVEEDPFVLVEVPCDQLPNWQAIVQFKVPQSVLDKIEDLDESVINPLTAEWSIEDINEAEGPIVNMDYFPVRITKFPKKPDGTTYTAPEFFQYFRKNLNSFLDQSVSQFGPYDAAENTIWLSSNPLGAVMRFDIYVTPIISQDGTVICSDNKESSWIFTTLKSPVDWNHPVSGHRKFGYEENSDGSYTFYTRGVDRVTEQTDLDMADFFGATTPFQGADKLWESFQQKLQDFINNPSNGGSAQKAKQSKYRPDWEKVKKVLYGERPVSDLGCN